MDLSKLPKLSDTDRARRQEVAGQADPAMPEASAEAEQRAQPVAYVRQPQPAAGLGAEVWLAVALGVIFMLLGRNFAAWLIASLTGQTYETGVLWSAGPLAGQPVAYWNLQGYTALNDAAIFTFGLATFVEGLALLAAARGILPKSMIALAMGLTVLATGLNLVVVVFLLPTGIFPLFSLLAIAFGGWMLMYQRAMWKDLVGQPSAV